MQLLVSVATAAEAADAVIGGADIIDAKDPGRGALGAVTPEVLRAIRAQIAGARPLSAALGDAATERAIARDACASAAAGVSFVKVGFAGVTSRDRAAALLSATVRGAADASEDACGVVAVAYADGPRFDSLTPEALIDIAVEAGACGVLLDTADKAGPGLRQLLPARAISAWVATARTAGLRVALAGRLAAEDLSFVYETGAGIAGVRAAACDGGRTGRVASAKVRALVDLVRRYRDAGDIGREGAGEVVIDEVAR